MVGSIGGQSHSGLQVLALGSGGVGHSKYKRTVKIQSNYQNEDHQGDDEDDDDSSNLRIGNNTAYFPEIRQVVDIIKRNKPSAHMKNPKRSTELL